MFRVETPRELTNWSRSLVQGAHDAATLIKEINCGKSFTTNNWCSLQVIALNNSSGTGTIFMLKI